MGLFGTGLGLPAAFGSLLQQQPEPKPSRDWGRGLTDIGTGLMAAQAAVDGDFGGSASLLGSLQERMAEQRQAQLQQQQRQAVLRAMAAKGLDPQVAGIFAGDPVAARQVLLPTQTEEDQFTRSMRAAGIDPSSPQGQQLYQQRVSTMANPAPNFLGDGLGGGRWVQPPAMPLPGVGSGMTPAPMGGGAPPQPAIEALKTNPALKDQFDAKYGAGASARYMGGGGGNATGSFRYR